ncbi:hypothetical protein BDV97DRAFT_113620 [Delphinella strobiligena]|nr:hypothetical protein BDV97DRAFT_113620 [Delphinella strobiligena]
MDGAIFMGWVAMALLRTDRAGLLAGSALRIQAKEQKTTVMMNDRSTRRHYGTLAIVHRLFRKWMAPFLNICKPPICDMIGLRAVIVP